MQLRRRSNGAPVLLGSVLGKGGEGSVFPVRGSPDLVAKIYAKAPTEAKIEKLQAMAGVHSPVLLRVAAWPVDLLEDEKKIVRGFLMPKVTSREDVHKLYSPKSRRRAFPEADFRFVVRAAANIARAFGVVHARGHVLGDVNHGNALVGRDGTVKLIDCDSFQIRGSRKSFTCDVGVPLFTPPELQGRVFRGLRRTANHDAFGLAVLLFHLLFLGRHPYAGRHEKGDMPIEQAIAESRFAYGAASASLGVSAPPGTLPLDTFGPEIAELFERAFEAPGGGGGGGGRGGGGVSRGDGGGKRPSAVDWVDALAELEAQLVSCANSRFHFRPGGGPACCWCEIEGRTRSRAFGPQGPIAEALSGERLGELWDAIASVGALPPAPAILKAFRNVPTASLAKRAARKFLHVDPSIGHVVTSWALVFLGLAVLVGRPGENVLASMLMLGLAASIRVPRLWRSLFSFKGELERELLLAEHRWKNAIERWNSECSSAGFDKLLRELEVAREELKNLPNTLSERLKDIQAGRFWKQKERYLNAARLVDEPFLHTTATDLAHLAGQNVTTAADIRRISAFLNRVVSQESARELLGWYSGLEKAFRYDANEPPDEDDAAKLAVAEKHLKDTEQRLLVRLKQGPALLQREKEQIVTARNKLDGPVKEAYFSLRDARRKAGLAEAASD